MVCPYDKKTICAFLEAKDPFNFACNKCARYIESTKATDDPIEGVKAVGCLFTGVAIIMAVLFVLYQVIRLLR